MTYKQALAQIEDLGVKAKLTQVKDLEAAVKFTDQQYRNSLRKIQNYITAYGQLPGEEITTMFTGIDKEIERLTRRIDAVTKKTTDKAVKDGLLAARRESAVLDGSLSFGGKVTVAPGSFAKMWRSAVNNLLTNQPGFNASDRIWDINKIALEDLKKYIAKGLVEGKFPGQIANDIRGFLILPDVDMRTKYWKNFMIENPPGTGNYRSAAKNMERLLRTENGRAYRMGTEEYAKSKSWALGVKWHRTPGYIECLECEEYATYDQGLGEGVYPPGEIPVSHPSCQCYLTTVPIEDKTTLK